jgi:hypothetical protein
MALLVEMVIPLGFLDGVFARISNTHVFFWGEKFIFYRVFVNQMLDNLLIAILSPKGESRMSERKRKIKLLLVIIITTWEKKIVSKLSKLFLRNCRRDSFHSPLSFARSCTKITKN